MLSKIYNVLILPLLLMLCMSVQAEEPSVLNAAEQGDMKAQAKLGSMYLLGQNGVEKDEQKAAEWLLKSASKGFIEAEVMIAAMYDRGLGVKSDIHAATKWYEKAAAQGHTTALAILGKNEVAKGSVAFNYQAMRLSAAKQIPTEYAKRILLTK